MENLFLTSSIFFCSCYFLMFLSKSADCLTELKNIYCFALFICLIFYLEIWWLRTLYLLCSRRRISCSYLSLRIAEMTVGLVWVIVLGPTEVFILLEVALLDISIKLILLTEIIFSSFYPISWPSKEINNILFIFFWFLTKKTIVMII